MNLGRRSGSHHTRASHIADSRHAINADKEPRRRIGSIGRRPDTVARLIHEIDIDAHAIQTRCSQTVGNFHHRVEALTLHGQLLLNLNLDLGAQRIDCIRSNRQTQQYRKQHRKNAARPTH